MRMHIAYLFRICRGLERFTNFPFFRDLSEEKANEIGDMIILGQQNKL